MTTTYCSEKVMLIISEKLGVDTEQISPDLAFRDDLGVDSLDFCEVVWEVEKRFKLTIADEDLEQIHTVGDLVELVDQRKVA